MKNTFKEYHQFSDQEFSELWKKSLFVFDTNTLLNMYRYSRNTVSTYFKVLNDLKNKKQIWIPYQVGFEFYERRVDVIAEYEGSYDSILSILEKAKTDIETKYKDHPFLDLCDIKKKMSDGLSVVEKVIEKAKDEHPKWMDKDDVLLQINQLFQNNTGINYDEKELISIRNEGVKRYEDKIPPGYKDDKKPEDKKYGDLILWYQIIDKAKESRKPIILISGDVKEDWWLQKNGKRIMPLPQLKKEMREKAGVDFHIYTADRFLEFYDKKIDKTTISEVRKIRELEEERMMIKRMEMNENERNLEPRIVDRNTINFLHLFEIISALMMKINQEEIHSIQKEELEHLYHRIIYLRNRIFHGKNDKLSLMSLHKYSQEFMFALNNLIHSEKLNPNLLMHIRDSLEKIEKLNHNFRKYL